MAFYRNGSPEKIIEKVSKKGFVCKTCNKKTNLLINDKCLDCISMSNFSKKKRGK